MTIDIYRRPNSYVGNTGSMAGWTLHGTFSGTSDGTVFSVDLQHAPIIVPAGGTATMGGSETGLDNICLKVRDSGIRIATTVAHSTCSTSCASSTSSTRVARDPVSA